MNKSKISVNKNNLIYNHNQSNKKLKYNVNSKSQNNFLPKFKQIANTLKNNQHNIILNLLAMKK